MTPQRLTHTVQFFDALSGSWVTKTVEGKPVIRPELRTGLTIDANNRMAFSPPTMQQALANAQRAFKLQQKANAQRAFPEHGTDYNINRDEGWKVNGQKPGNIWHYFYRGPYSICHILETYGEFYANPCDDSINGVQTFKTLAEAKSFLSYRTDVKS